MNKEEKEKRIKTSKYFFLKLNEINKELNQKEKELDFLLNEGGPTEFKKESLKTDLKIQQSKKNYSAEFIFKDYEERLNNKRLEIKKLENQYKKNKNLLDKINNNKYKYFLLAFYIFKLSTKEIKEIFKCKNDTKNKYINLLENSLICFSYVLENEFKKRV